MSKKGNKKALKKRKLKIRSILIFLILVFCILLTIWYVNNINITNIYITGNKVLNDQEVMEIAKIDDYPKSLKNNSKIIKERLEANDYIKSAIVKKRGILNEVYITIDENNPLFYYQPENKIVLSDGKKVDKNFIVPVVINKIPNSIYDDFLDCMGKIDESVLIKISEIKYDPNDIDKERFYLTMNDGNYVYLTLSKFANVNNYIDIVKSFNNAKGILYLDSGEYFEIFDND